MSSFDDFFIRNKDVSLLTRFNYRKSLELNRTPLYFKSNKDFYKNKLFIKLENFFFFSPMIKIFGKSKKKSFSIPLHHYNFKTLNKKIMNYRKGNEPELAHLIDLLMPDDGVFFDCGANWGEFTFYLYSRETFVGEIYSFEPVKYNIKAFNYINNKISIDNRIKFFKKALSNKKESDVIYYNIPETASASLIKPSKKKRNNSKYILQIDSVETDIIDNYKIQRLDFLKIDVEGKEFEVLEGAIKHIQDFKPFIFLENTLIDTNEIEVNKSIRSFNLLKKMGYKLFLPSWVQREEVFFVGIGLDFEMDHFSLTPFEPEERSLFPIEILNTFACHESKVDQIGVRFKDYFKNRKLLNLVK